MKMAKMSKKHSATRILAIFLSALMIFTMLPLNMFSAMETNEDYGILSAITSGGNVTNANGENATVTYADGAVLEWSSANTAIGRNADGWWIGILMTAPAGMLEKADFVSEDNTDLVTYKTKTVDGWSVAKSFWNAQDSDKSAVETQRFIQLWGHINEEYLNDALLNGKGDTLDFSWCFDWNGDGEYEQTATLKVEPEDIILNKGAVQVYPAVDSVGLVQAITDGLKVDETSKNYVKVVSEDIELAWIEKGDVRPDDGWWAGIKVNAPANADFANATYQRKVGDGWSEATNFWGVKDSADDADSHNITLWGLLNKEYLESFSEQGRNLNYIWRFDWNGDGVYEQIVHLELLPETIVLNDENGNQVYPNLATVVPLTGGTVTGETGELTLLLEEANINWSPADTSIGRNTDGWWVGMRINAPEGYSEETLKKATYDRLLSGNENETEDISFWSVKDSKEEPHYLEMWLNLNAALIKKYKDLGKNIENSYTFDWDGDGKNDQTINFNIVPSEKIVLNKVEQTGFGFVDSAPVVWVGEETFSHNKATGGQSSKDVVYSIDGNAATIDADTGEVTLLKAGTVVVTATKPGDDVYEDVTASYTLTITKKEQIGFTINQPSAVDFEEGKIFENEATGGQSEIDVIYEIVASESLEGEKLGVDEVATIDASSGTLTLLRSGKVTVRALKGEDEKYYETFDEYTLTVNRGNQEVVFEKGTNISPITFGAAFANVANALSKEITYTSSDNSIANVYTDGNLNTIKAGTVTITATALQDEKYNSASASYTITINKAQQVITFEKGTYTTDGYVVETTYNAVDNHFTNPAKSNKNIKDCVYSVSFGSSYIENFDPTTGEFDIVKAGGPVVISVIFAETDCYASKTASYALMINKAEQEITFSENSYSVITGEDFSAPVATEKSELYGEGEITYSVKDDENGIIKAIDSTTGAVELTYKAGTAVIMATKATDTNYKEATAEYTLVVSEWIPAEKNYTIVDSNGNEVNSAGWFNSNVSILANNGYEVATIQTNGNADWSGKLTDIATAESDNNIVSFYVKDLATGYISKAYTETIKIDTTVPTGAITVESNVWDKVLEIITFGLWSNEEIDFTIDADDTLSGVAKIEYYVVNENASVALDKTALDNIPADSWKEYKGDVVTITEEATFVVYAKITDNAGNYYYVSSDGLIYDITAPSVEVELPESVNGYYSDDFDVSVKVEEENNSFSGIKEISYEIFNGDVLTQSGVLYSAEKEGFDGKTYESANAFIVDSYLNNSDTVKIVVTATDNAGNKTTVSKSIMISAEPPSITIDFETLEAVTKDNVDYYGEARTAIITIKGRNSAFSAENVKLNITAEDKSEAEVKNSYSYDVGSWTLDENGNYFSKIVFNGSAIYSFSVEYQDLAGLVAEKVAVDDFVVDTVAPTGTITVSELGVWENLIETLTFGLWSNKAVDIEVTSEDTVSPIKLVEYYKTDAKTALTTTELDAVTDWKEYKEFSIENDEVFTVYAKITDNSGNVTYISTNGAVVDLTKPLITITPDNANDNGIYNNDVNVNIDVMESANYSGLNKVEYWVVSDGTETYRETLYSFDIEDSKYEELVDGFNEDVVVKASDNNSCNVELFVGVTDNAGNYSKESVKLDVDVTAPTIDVSYDNNDAYKVVGDHGYFAATRTATVVFTERTEHFDEAKATEGIVITATDATGNTIYPEVSIVWSHEVNSANPDLDKHIATIAFAEDANYKFSVSYTDKSDNENEPVNTNDSVTPYSFTVDTALPTGTVEVEDYGIWNDLLELLTFGLWSNETVDVKATYADATADIESVEYYITDGKTIKTIAELDEITEWKEYSDFSVLADEIFTVYIKITDNSGNVKYLSTDGVVVDATEAEITLTPDKPNENGIYNGDVNVEINVVDPGKYSGLNKVEYWVEKDGATSPVETLYEFDVVSPRYEDLKPTFNTTKVVDAIEYNSCNVEVFVGVTDNAGNYSEKSVKLDIDVTAPTIDVTYDNNDAYKVVGDHGYFDAIRTATVVITERTAHFDEVEATKGILITATDANGRVFDPEVTITWSNSINEENPDLDKHIATIVFAEDANYEFSISYTDMADNANEPVNTGNSVTPYSFSVDTTKPEGTVTVGTLGTWDDLIEFLTFGLWSKDTVEVTETHEDATAGVESVHYYKTSVTTALKESDLEALAEGSWTVFDPFEVTPNETFTVYVRIIDNSGNVKYISTNGIIVDDVKPEFLPAIEDVKPEITLAPVENDVNGLYNSDVNIAVSVKDPIIDESYSGLKEIRYEVYSLGVKTQEGVLYSFDYDEPTQDMLLQSWNSESYNSYITVDSKLNNSNDVVVKVFALDNSGNENEDEIALQIDITNPTIDVTYNNNNGDTTFKESTYFDANRTATVVITERNFNADNVVITITNTDKVVPVASEWKTVNGTGNGDDTTHTATIVYNADGDYTFDISYVDEATNTNDKVNYGDSLAPTAFTIDKTAPVVTLEYDNNDALNGNYYKAQRIATITVTEHNFETGRIRMLLEATDDGVNTALPAVSKWTSVGDVHTAIITYAADSLYTFDFDYQDKAGNATADIPQQSFYVDKTNPAVSITKIVDQSANNSEGDIGFVITAIDTNFDKFTPVLTVTDINGNSTKLNVGSVSDIHNGKVFTVKNIVSDGIYRITCTVVDKAGNEYSEVTLQKTDGSTYVANRSGNDTLVTFSVNRDGSTYEIKDNTADLINKYYVQNVTDDVVIVETNADPLSEYKVILNGKELAEGTDYTVAESGGNGSWMKYTYTINKAIFADEGEYKLVVSSKDKAENDAFSDLKNATVNFVVDRTAPVVTVTGMANAGEYVTESQTVTITPTDDGGALKSLVVRFVDEDGNVIKEIINLSGEELEKALEENGKISFNIDRGMHQNIQIVCNDCAVDENGETNTYDETYINVSVSPSEFELFWGDPVKRWATIGGVVLLTSIIIFIIVKKKKKDDKEDKK